MRVRLITLETDETVFVIAQYMIKVHEISSLAEAKLAIVTKVSPCTEIARSLRVSACI